MKLQKLFLSDEEFGAVESLVAALEVVEINSRKLCRRNDTLASADKIFEFMLAKLYKQTSSIGRQLYTSVEARIKERRNVDLSTLPAFLADVIYWPSTLYQRGSQDKRTEECRSLHSTSISRRLRVLEWNWGKWGQNTHLCCSWWYEKTGLWLVYETVPQFKKWGNDRRHRCRWVFTLIMLV